MCNFENEFINGMFMSQYVTSFCKYNRMRFREFREWLETLVINGRHLTEEEIYKIASYGDNGKCELETLSQKWSKRK